MAVEAYLPKIGTVVVTALIDSINPCAIGVLILLVSTLLVSSQSRARMLKLSAIYISAVYVTYFLAGLGLTAFLSRVPLFISQYLSVVVGIAVVFGGLIEIKDFYWYGRGISLAISTKHASRIHQLTKKITFPGMVLLGAFVAGVELPCTGGPYLAITLLLAQNFNFIAVLLLAFYNLIFVAPLIVIVTMVYFGAKIHHIKRWKHHNRRYMRLFIGLLLVALGWLLMLIANGTINLG